MVALSTPRVIEGEGTSEPIWLAWDGLARLPVLSLAHWVAAAQRLVVVAPHPDDEILAGGALASMHAKRGGEVAVIAVTDGEASHRGSRRWSPGSLAAERRSESTEGLAMLLAPGTPVVRLGLPDSDVAAHASALQAELQQRLRPTDVLVTTWRFDGHPDHDATGSAAAAACAAVGCRLVEAPVWMWHWAEPDDPRVPWTTLRGLAISNEALARRRLAIASHATQLAPRDTGEGPVLTASLLERLERNIDYFLG